MRLSTLLLLGIFLIPQFGYALGGSTCAQATVVGALPYTDSGQLESGYDPNCPGEPVNDLFYIFTASQNGTYRFDMCGSNNCCSQQMRLWTDGTCCSGASVTVDSGCVDAYPQYDLVMTSGQVVYIEVGKSGSEWAVAPLYQFNVAVVVLVPNDVCPGTSISSLPFVETASIAGAMHDYSGPCATGTSPDVVYSFTPTDSVQLYATVTSPVFVGHALAVIRGECGSGIQLLCGTGTGFDPSTVLFWAEPDSTYYLVVEVNSLNADYTFTLEQLPLYDICPGTVIPSLPFVDSSSTALAVHNYEAYCNPSTSSPDVVYSFVTGEELLLEVKVKAGWSEALHIYQSTCGVGAIYCDIGFGPDSVNTTFTPSPNVPYYFIVDGVDFDELGPFVFSLRSLECTAPDSLTIQQSGDDIILRWPHVDCDTPTYKIYRATSPDVPIEPANLIGTTTDSTYIDTGILLTPDILNFYVITAE